MARPARQLTAASRGDPGGIVRRRHALTNPATSEEFRNMGPPGCSRAARSVPGWREVAHTRARAASPASPQFGLCETIPASLHYGHTQASTNTVPDISLRGSRRREARYCL
jgi:hypothetical protein